MNNELITRKLENVTQEQLENVIKYLDAQRIENDAVSKGKTNEDIIRLYLEGLAKNHPDLAAKFPNNPMGKTMKDCMEYIESLARKMAGNSQMATVTSFTVFNWAILYFTDDSIKKHETPKPTPVVKTTATHTQKVDLKALLAEKETWEKENKAKIDEWEQKHNAEIDDWESKHPADLFGYKPENPFLKKQNPYLNMVFPKQGILDKAIEAQKPSQTASTPPTPKEPEPDPDAVGELVYETETAEEETDNQ